jgi:hypothetical protein
LARIDILLEGLAIASGCKGYFDARRRIFQQ